MTAPAIDSQRPSSQVRSTVGKFDRAVKLYALRQDAPDARRLCSEVYFELLHLSVYGGGLSFKIGEQGLESDGELLLTSDAAPWVQNLWTSGFRDIALEPGMEESELNWLLELLAEEESQDLAWRAWAQNPSQIRFHIASMPPLTPEMDTELTRLANLVEANFAPRPTGARLETWTGGRDKDFPAPDPKLRHSIVREFQAESLHLLGQRLLQRLLEAFRHLAPDVARKHVEDLGWVSWHFAHQPELRGSGKLLRELQDTCHALGLQSFGEDALAPAPRDETLDVAAAAHEAGERLEAILSKPEVSQSDVAALLHQAEARLGYPTDLSVESAASRVSSQFRAYKGIKFTVTADPAPDKKEATRSRERRRDEAFWKVDTDAQGDDVIDALFGEVFGDEPEDTSRLLSTEAPAARPKPEPVLQSFEVEEESVNLAALGFDPALLKKKPTPAPAPRSSDPEPDRPELLWSDMDLDVPGEPAAEPLPPAPKATPAPARKPVAEDPQHAETQKLKLRDIANEVARDAARRQGTPSPAPATPPPAPVERVPTVADALSRGRVLRAQGRLIEARHLLHRASKEAPDDQGVAEEFKRVQHELRLNCARQLRNESLIPQLQLPPGSPQHQALLQAPAGGVLRRVNGASTLREIRSELELLPEEFEKQMSSLMEWGFVTLHSRKR